MTATSARPATPATIMAIGLVYVLSAGEIDLSFGSITAVSALAAAVTMQSYPMPLGVAAGLGVANGDPKRLWQLVGSGMAHDDASFLKAQIRAFSLIRIGETREDEVGLRRV